MIEKLKEPLAAKWGHHSRDWWWSHRHLPNTPRSVSSCSIFFLFEQEIFFCIFNIKYFQKALDLCSSCFCSFTSQTSGAAASVRWNPCLQKWPHRNWMVIRETPNDGCSRAHSSAAVISDSCWELSGWDFGCQAVLSEPNLKEHLEQISKWNRSTACIFVLVFFPDKNQWNKSDIFLPFSTLLQQSIWSLAFGWIKIPLVDMTLVCKSADKHD